MAPILLATFLSLTAVGAEIEPTSFDTAGIAAALEKAQPGDVVRLPEGTFEIAKAISMKSGVKLLGAGQDKTRIVYRGDAQGVLLDFSGCEDAELADLTFDGENNPLVKQGIVGRNARRLSIHHITICNLINSGSFGPHAIIFDGDSPTLERGVVDSRIADCRMENIGVGASFGGGIRLSWGCVRNRIERNEIHNTGRGGVFGDHSDDLTILGNRVSGSGGEGLGIEVWEGCSRALIEDNTIDHWLSVGGGQQTAVRRNVVEATDGSLKGIGIEVIARDCVVTDNRVGPGQMTGLSVSNAPVKNNIYWANNTVSGCVQWGAQLQGDAGGIAHHYFYRCNFENTLRDDPRAQYPGCTGFGFRFNGASSRIVFDECAFRNNGGLGVQLGGENVDAIRFLRCSIVGNGGPAVQPPQEYSALAFEACQVRENASDALPAMKPFPAPPPTAAFDCPETTAVGQPIVFQCKSTSATPIVDRLWDFGHGLPEVAEQIEHRFDRPGKFCVVLIVWNESGQAARVEKDIEVTVAQPK